MFAVLYADELKELIFTLLGNANREEYIAEFVEAQGDFRSMWTEVQLTQILEEVSCGGGTSLIFCSVLTTPYFTDEI